MAPIQEMAYESVVDSRRALDDVRQIMKTNKGPGQDRALSSLAYNPARETVPYLLTFLDDPQWRISAVRALVQHKDSRASLPIAKRLIRNAPPAVSAQFLDYFSAVRDPRAELFLKKYQKEKRALSQKATRARVACSNNADFLYVYGGPENLYEQRLAHGGRTQVTSHNLNALEGIFERDKQEGYDEEEGTFYRPQSYIVTADGTLFVGGDQHEHVFIAKGEPARAGGEISFMRTPRGWRVNYINCRSSGYIFHPSCFAWVKQYFEKSDVLFDKPRFNADRQYPRGHDYLDGDFLSQF